MLIWRKRNGNADVFRFGIGGKLGNLGSGLPINQHRIACLRIIDSLIAAEINRGKISSGAINLPIGIGDLTSNLISSGRSFKTDTLRNSLALFVWICNVNVTINGFFNRR